MYQVPVSSGAPQPIARSGPYSTVAGQLTARFTMRILLWHGQTQSTTTITNGQEHARRSAVRPYSVFCCFLSARSTGCFVAAHLNAALITYRATSAVPTAVVQQPEFVTSTARNPTVNEAGRKLGATSSH